MSVTVAVVGRGFGTAVHAPGWRIVGAETVTVAGRDDWREAIAGADVVSVATPPAERVEVVLSEKPLASTVADAELLEREARRVPNAVNFSYRALPAFRRFRELLDADELHVRWTTSSRLRPGTPGWRDDPSQGGALAAYGVHALDYARWLLGEAEVEAATVAPREDAFTAVLRHERGRATIDVSLVEDERMHRVEAGELVLESLHPTDPVGTFALRRRGGIVSVEPLPPTSGDPRIAPFAVHARALLAGADRPTFTDGLQAQRLLEEVRRAAS